jgi:uncharacterized protein with PQ loop repeat
MPLASIVGWGGATIGTLTTVVQTARIRRVGTDGVNATTWSLFALTSVFWLAYGVASHSDQIVAASVIGAPFLIGLLARLDQAARRRGIAHAALAVAATTWLPAALFGWNAGLLGVGVLVVATRAPQLTQLLGTRHARGVSATAWLLGAVSVAMWLAYDVSTSRTAAAVTMVAALVANLSIVTLAVTRHRGGRAATVTSRAALAT